MRNNQILKNAKDGASVETLSEFSYRAIVEAAKSAGVRLFSKEAIIRTLLSAVSAMPAAAEELPVEPTLDERAAKALRHLDTGLTEFHGVSMISVTSDILGALKEGTLAAEFYDLCEEDTVDAATCVSFIRRKLTAENVNADEMLEKLADSGESLTEAVAARKAVDWQSTVPSDQSEDAKKIRASEEAYRAAMTAYRTALSAMFPREIEKSREKAAAALANQNDHLNELAEEVSNVSGVFEHKAFRAPIEYSFRASAWRKYGKARCYIDSSINGAWKKFGFVEGGKFYANDVYAAPIQKHLEEQVRGILN